MDYKLNDIISVTVTSVASYGVFVKCDFDYTGLIHISEISKNYIKDLSKLYKKDNIIKAKIISIDEDNKRLSLSIKELLNDNKKSENELVEEGTGFEELKDNLPKWIDSAKKEMENSK